MRLTIGEYLYYSSLFMLGTLYVHYAIFYNHIKKETEALDSGDNKKTEWYQYWGVYYVWFAAVPSLINVFNYKSTNKVTRITKTVNILLSFIAMFCCFRVLINIITDIFFPPLDWEVSHKVSEIPSLFINEHISLFNRLTNVTNTCFFTMLSISCLVMRVYYDTLRIYNNELPTGCDIFLSAPYFHNFLLIGEVLDE